MSSKRVLLLVFLSFIYQSEVLCSEEPNWRDIAIGSAIGFTGVAIGSFLVWLFSPAKQQNAFPQQPVSPLVMPQLSESALVPAQDYSGVGGIESPTQVQSSNFFINVVKHFRFHWSEKSC